jgi:hypothetical protein
MSVRHGAAHDEGAPLVLDADNTDYYDETGESHGASAAEAVEGAAAVEASVWLRALSVPSLRARRVCTPSRRHGSTPACPAQHRPFGRRC